MFKMTNPRKNGASGRKASGDDPDQGGLGCDGETSLSR
jgi:hypothetical protein